MWISSKTNSEFFTASTDGTVALHHHFLFFSSIFFHPFFLQFPYITSVSISIPGVVGLLPQVLWWDIRKFREPVERLVIDPKVKEDDGSAEMVCPASCTFPCHGAASCNFSCTLSSCQATSMCLLLQLYSLLHLLLSLWNFLHILLPLCNPLYTEKIGVELEVEAEGILWGPQDYKKNISWGLRRRFLSQKLHKNNKILPKMIFFKWSKMGQNL